MLLTGALIPLYLDHLFQVIRIYHELGVHSLHLSNQLFMVRVHLLKLLRRYILVRCVIDYAIPPSTVSRLPAGKVRPKLLVEKC